MASISLEKLVAESVIDRLEDLEQGGGGTGGGVTSYDDLTDKPFIPTTPADIGAQPAGSYATTASLASKADLVGGFVPSSQIPAVALTSTFVVASQAAMLALTTAQVQPGDIAVRTDGAGTYVLSATDPSVIGSWTRLNTPTDVVISINGQQGTVVLGKADIGLGNVTNVAPADLPVSTATQAAIDAKADRVVTANVQSGAAYTLALPDGSNAVETTNTGAVAVTVPTNAAVAFPLGTVIEVTQIGTGQVTLTPAAGVTLLSRGGALKIAGQYGIASIRKRGTNEWVVGGDVTA